MKKPKFLTKLAAMLPARPKKRYNATARAARPTQIEEYDVDQPTTKLSSAFVVVLILHVVAVAGIYAFNSIKASRRSHALIAASTSSVGGAAAKSAGDTDSAPAVPQVPAANPAASHPATGHPAVPAPTQTSASPAPAKLGPHQYQVKAGDNVTKIAFAYRITTAELMAANDLKDNSVLRVGQTLTIPTAKADAKTPADTHKADTPAAAKLTDIPPTKTTPGLHIVKKGDTAHSIAKTYGMTAEELIKLNKIADPKKLQLGQALKIPPRKS